MDWSTCWPTANDEHAWERGDQHVLHFDQVRDKLVHLDSSVTRGVATKLCRLSYVFLDPRPVRLLGLGGLRDGTACVEIASFMLMERHLFPVPARVRPQMDALAFGPVVARERMIVQLDLYNPTTHALHVRPFLLVQYAKET